MNYIRNHTTTSIFAALIPLVLIFTFIILNRDMASGGPDKDAPSQWKHQMEDVTFPSEKLEKLTEILYKESKGNGRPEIIATLTFQIIQELADTPEASPLVLTDLLRDISLEHPDWMVRLYTYEAMLVSLDTEHIPSRDGIDLANF